MTTTVAGVIASIVVARSVGPAGRGTLLTVTVWGQILGWLAAFSLDKAVVVLTSGKEPVSSPDDALRTVRLPVLGLSGLAVVASVVLGRHFFSSAWLIGALAAYTVAAAQAELIAGWLLATGRRAAFVAWRLLQPTLYVLLIVIAAVALRGISTADRTVALCVGASLSVILPVVLVLGVLPRRPMFSTCAMRPLLRFGAATQVANVLQYLNGRLDLLVLTFLVSASARGDYAAGAAVGQIALLMAAAGAIRGMTGQAHRTDFVGIAMSMALAAIVFVLAPTVIPLVFGSSFEGAVPIARILAIGAVVNYALQAADGRLLWQRRPWTVVCTQGVGVVVFAIGIVAFPTPEGIAWSSVVSFAVSFILAQIALLLRGEPEAAPVAVADEATIFQWTVDDERTV